MAIDIFERVRRYLAAIGPATAGSGESHKVVVAACMAGHDFGIELDHFMPILDDWNGSNNPPLKPQELRTQVSSAYRSAKSPFGHKRTEGGPADDGPPPPPPPPPEYPPVGEVAQLWEQCMGVDEHPAAAAWVASRGLDVGRLSTPRELPMARALRRVAGPNHPAAREGTKLQQPRWAGIGAEKITPWADTGYQLLIPCYDAAGTMRSFRARWVLDSPPPLGKAIPPRGFEARGLVMCNLSGLYLLRFGRWPDEQLERDRQLWIVEGEPDTLTLADMLRTTKSPERAVWGLYNGSWTAELAARIPDNADVVIGIHDDKAGQVYTDKVDRTLHGRVRLRRHVPKQQREAE